MHMASEATRLHFLTCSLAHAIHRQPGFPSRDFPLHDPPPPPNSLSHKASQNQRSTFSSAAAVPSQNPFSCPKVLGKLGGKSHTVRVGSDAEGGRVPVGTGTRELEAAVAGQSMSSRVTKEWSDELSSYRTGLEGEKQHSGDPSKEL